MNVLTIEQVQALSVRERCDYLNALPFAERIECLRALTPREQAFYLGELGRRNLEAHRRAAAAALGQEGAKDETRKG